MITYEWSWQPKPYYTVLRLEPETDAHGATRTTAEPVASALSEKDARKAIAALKRQDRLARVHERAERGRIRREAQKAIEARQEAKRQKAVTAFQIERSKALLVSDLVKLGRACGGEVLTFVDAAQDELHVPARALARLADLPKAYAKRVVCTFRFREHVPCLEVSWSTGKIRFHVGYSTHKVSVVDGNETKEIIKYRRVDV